MRYPALFFIWPVLATALYNPLFSAPTQVVSGAPASSACNRPELLQALSTTDSSATLTWSDVGDAYELEVIPATGSFTGMPTHTVLASPPYVLIGLIPGVQYRFSVRTICNDQSRSAWSIPRSFRTAMNNSRPCPLSWSLSDTNCLRLPVYVDDAPGSALGVDVLLSEIRIVLEHRWRSDIRLFLEAPDGARIQLVGGFNAGDDHLGNPDGSDCPPAFVLTDAIYAQALQTTSGVDAPVGYFRPVEPLSMLMNGQNPGGIWQLEICDDKIDDTGLLRAFGMVFTLVGCGRPDSVWVSDVDVNHAVVRWSPMFPNDILVVEYGPVGFFPGIDDVPGVGGAILPVTNTDSVVLQNLMPLTDYEVYVRRLCPNGVWSANGQSTSFFTACTPTLQETADTLGLCPSGCADPCPLSAVWQNVPLGDDFEWKVRTGPGIAWPNAGPPAAAGGPGNYFYFRNSCSFNGANGKKAFLRSRCIDVVAEPDAVCHFSVDLYMHTNIGQMGSLAFQVSTNGGNTWSTLRTWTGNQGKGWKTAYIRLDAYDGQSVLFQFVATGALGAYGDIALDNVRFYGSQFVGNPDFVFFRDMDGDGWGLESVSIAACSAQAPPGFTQQSGDCNDNNPSIFPSAPEQRCNGIDDNCNGTADDAAPAAPVLQGDTVCRGETGVLYTVQNTLGMLYWFDATGQVLHAGDTLYVIGLGTSTYFAKDSIPGKCASPGSTVQLVVRQAPSLIGPPALSLCLGDSLDLAAQGVQDTAAAPGDVYYYSTFPPEPSFLVHPTLIAPVQSTTFFAVKTTPEGCVDVLELPLSVNVLPMVTLNVPDTLALCRGAQKMVTAMGVGGAAPYTVQWSNGSMLPSVNLNAGTTPGTTIPYTVTLTDAAGCSASSGLMLQTLGGISQTEIVLVLPAGVCGGADGAIVLRPLDGQAPYNFAWSGPAPGMLTNAPAGETVLSGLKTGVYRVSVTDQSATGCNMVLPQIVVNAPGFSVQIDTLQHPHCAGGADGRIVLDVQGANPQITWSNNQTGPIANQLAAGTYTATVTVGGCSKILDNLTLADPPLLSPFVNAITNERCFGQQDGRIDVSVQGGTPPYLYDWSNAFSGEDPEALEPGIYVLTVVDANGCSAVLTNMEVEGPTDSLALVITTVDSIRCFGDQNGQLWAQANGGTMPYAFEWSDGSPFERLYGIPAAAYSATVSDAQGCTAMAFAVLTQPDVLEAGLAVQQPTCSGAANGKIMAVTSGGTTPYYYDWNTGGQTEVLNNLDLGLYQLTVNDAHGCTVASLPVMLDAPQVLDLVVDSISDVRCAGVVPGGHIGVLVSGGTAPLMYVWDGQPGGPVLANTTAGQHFLVVTDAMQCVLRDTFEIQGPTTALSMMLVSVQNAFCAGEPSGSISIKTEGGTPPYAWDWNGQTDTENLSAEPAGDYAVTVTDALGCTSTLGPVTINAPPAINVQVSTVDIPCFGPQTGSVFLSVSGGVAPYTYNWSTGQAAPGVFGLAAGKYAVTISDATGCALVLPDVQVSRKIDNVRALVASVSPVSCNEASDGKIVVLAQNARAPYQFAWSAPVGLHPNVAVPIDSAVNLSGGAYSVLVTDADGCSFRSDTIWIEEAPLIKVGFQGQTQIACKGDSTGSLEALVSGGLPPYVFAWSTSGSTSQISDLTAGSYAVSVTDEQGCTAVAGPVVIQQPAQALNIVSAQVTNDDCATGKGRIAIMVSGGKQPYAYAWNNGAMGSVIDSLFAGAYASTITDALGCAVQSSVYALTGAAQPVALQVLGINEPACHGDSTGSIALQPTGGYGGYTLFWSVGGSGTTIGQLPAGMYTVTLTDQEGCSTTATYTVNQPPAFIFSSATDSFSTGWTVSLTLAGGTPPYNILWNAAAGNQTGLVATGLAGGEYEATATDAKGCVYRLEGIVAGTISTDGLVNARETALWPNPSNGWLRVYWPGASASKRLLLYSQDGHLKLDWAIQAESDLLDLRSLSSGVYWLTGLDNGVRVFIERIVKI